MEKVYAVVTGEYSDYEICAVFSSFEKADKFCAKRNGTSICKSFWVEIYNVDDCEE